MSSSESNLQTTAEAGASLSPGQQLVRAREAAGLSRDELAVRLCMTVTKLEHLEQDDYERLSGATYARGYIRNVCKELKLDSAPVLAALEERLPAENEQPAMPPKGPLVGGATGARSGGVGFAPVALAALLAAGGGYWWYAQGQPGIQPLAQSSSPSAGVAEPTESDASTNPVEPAQSFSTAAEYQADPEVQHLDSEPQSMEPELVADSAPVSDVDSLRDAFADQAEPVAGEEVVSGQGIADAGALTEETMSEEMPEDPVVGVVEDAAVETAAAAPVVPVVDPQARVETALAETVALAMTFSEESWVEVTDAQGNKLLAKLQPAGSSVELSGEAPFSLMLGNAAATTVSYQGEVVDSAPLGNRRTRKLTVGG